MQGYQKLPCDVCLPRLGCFGLASERGTLLAITITSHLQHGLMVFSHSAGGCCACRVHRPTHTDMQRSDLVASVSPMWMRVQQWH